MVTPHWCACAAALAVALAGCDGCTSVVVEDDDGGGGGGGGPGGGPTTCEGLCQERFDKLECDLELCHTNCTEELRAELEAIDCYETMLDFMRCVNRIADSCDDGCPEQVGHDYIDCLDRLDNPGGGGGAP